ncbi:MAG: HAMP domain-containing sensor histidine kinase [Planctomycetota bacterium]
MIRLPCPADDILEIVAAAAGTEDAFASKLHAILRTNPSLLIFALIRYRQQQQVAAPCPRALVRWCQRELIGELAIATANSIDDSFDSESLNSEFWIKFLRCRKRSKLKSILKRWLNLVGIQQDSSKTIIKQVLTRSFRADQFSAKRVRRNSTLKAVVETWQNPLMTKVSLTSLLQVAVEQRESAADFHERVQHAKLAAMKQLAYGASHEINNPLANIATRAQSLLLDETNPERRYRLAVIYQQAMRAHEMISDMMLFAHPPTVQLKHVSLRLMMRRFLEHWKREQPESKVELKIFLSAGLDRAELDEQKFLVALQCLVKNSCEAIAGQPSSSGAIEIRLDRDAGSLSLSVIDDGVGVSPRVAPHLFDPFFSGREAGRGLGFGLSKVWRIAQQHAGTVYHDQHWENGTRFVLQIPVRSWINDDRPIELAHPMEAELDSESAETHRHLSDEVSKRKIA